MTGNSKSGWQRPAGLSIALLTVALVTLWVRYASLEPVEIGGDALRVWEFGRQLAFGMPLPNELDHHQARFGLVLPTLLLQKLVGTSAVHYYAGPLVMGAVLHAAVFFIGLRLSGVLAATIAVVWLLLFPEMARPSSQILPELYGPTYTMLAVASALVFSTAESARARWLALVFAAASLFFAYGSKLSYLYFAPGVAAFFVFGRPVPQPAPSLPPSSSPLRRALTWARTKRLLHAGILTALVFLLIGVETLFYRLLTEQQGQLAVVENSHRVSKTVIQSTSDLFAIYRHAGTSWAVAFATGGVALGVLLALTRSRLVRLFALLSVVYLLLFTFVLRRWNPPTPWAEPHPRYLLALAPCIAVVVGGAVEELFRRALRFVGEERRPLTLRTLSLGMALGVFGVAVYEPASRLELGELPASRGIRVTQRLARDMTRAYEAGIPLVSTNRPPKPLVAAASLFIEPTALLHEGGLPDPSDLIRNARKQGKRPLYYLSAELLGHGVRKTALDAAVVERSKQARCVVTMSQYGRFFRMTPKRTSRCSPLVDPVRARALPPDPRRPGAD